MMVHANVTRRVVSFRSGRETTVHHRYAINSAKADYGFQIDNLPFSHPRQLAELLPTLRQWASVGSLLRDIFVGAERSDHGDDGEESFQAPLAESSSNHTSSLCGCGRAGGVCPAATPKSSSISLRLGRSAKGLLLFECPPACSLFATMKTIKGSPRSMEQWPLNQIKPPRSMEQSTQSVKAGSAIVRQLHLYADSLLRSLAFRSQSQCAEYLHPSSFSSLAAIPVQGKCFSPKSSLPVPSCACNDSADDDDDILSAPHPLSPLTPR